LQSVTLVHVVILCHVVGHVMLTVARNQSAENV